MEFFYGKEEDQNNPKLYALDCEHAIEILRRRGFNEEILENEIQVSKQDYGDEFFWTVLHYPEMVDEWADKHGLSDNTSARNFVLLCLDFG